MREATRPSRPRAHSSSQGLHKKGPPLLAEGHRAALARRQRSGTGVATARGLEKSSSSSISSKSNMPRGPRQAHPQSSPWIAAAQSKVARWPEKSSLTRRSNSHRSNS